ncbi:penicillin-binding protein 1B [Thalassotalea euphylliae]|uniref:penicillin-binding protein 1B n=1 Tax=Thalassotalea euphylliae TaxID=1655234 RepID=UPI003625639C
MKKSWGRWLSITFLKLSLAAIAFLTVYVIYLDAKVRDKFEGERWQIPLQVFSKQHDISVGDSLNLNLLADVLKSVGYQKVQKVWRPKQFALSATRIILFRRAFDTSTENMPAASLTIDVQNGKVTRLYQDDIAVQQVTIEPQSIARILPENKEDRLLVGLEAVPESLLDTLLLVEDRDFYFHKGVSPHGILRALYTNLSAGRTVQGGSTLTQQLVKNMYLTREKTLVRKLNEAIMALLLEFRYSKDQLLEAYINEVYLGQHYANGVYGFGLAAEFYFGQNINQLTPAQMALLVGVIKGPSLYDPWRKPENAKKRRDLVLRLMFEHQLLGRHQYELAVNSTLGVRTKRRLAKHQFYSYVQLVKQELSPLLETLPQSEGLKVYTGFSLLTQQQLQITAEKTLKELEVTYKQSALQAAVIVTDLNTGEVSALLGDRNHSNNGFNRALNAKRQIGSLIKPAVYLPALERYQQFTLATVIEDKPINMQADNGSTWQPKNYSGKFKGQVPLIDGLVESLNIPTVNLGMTVGLDNVNQALQMLGYQENVTLRPSMLLGAVTMSPYDINQLYVPIANYGYYMPTHAITRITSHTGETLWQFDSNPEPRISQQTAFLLNYALTEAAQRGTAKSLSWRLKGANVAGKTGTTNDERDSWFVGYDQQTLVTTWIGNDDNKPTNLTGSSGALVLYANLMKSLGVKNLDWSQPDAIAITSFETQTGNAVRQTCQSMAKYPAVTIDLTLSDCMEKIEDKRSWLERLFGD